MAEQTRTFIVASFDIGTTYSGFAFSFKYNPKQVYTNHVWKTTKHQFMSLKAPTCVVLTENKEFHSFGFEAENEYAELAENKKQGGLLYFHRFKMVLYNTKVHS